MANPNSPASAKPVTISALDKSLLNEKLRIAGLSLSYDHEGQILLVHDGVMHACLVDTSLVRDSLITLPNLRESKAVVTLIGYLECVKETLPIPTIPPFTEAPMIDPTLVIRAILITPSPSLSLLQWEDSVRRSDQASKSDVLWHNDRNM